MAVLVREDGERFVVPSYRDILTAKSNTLLKREILLLSSNYGEYITLQRRRGAQYEVAFSSEVGYLLGESVWDYFKRPQDLIYCETLPDRNEAILVIVKGGSVYLDGSFPIEGIVEELVVFQTQKNNFEVHIYGDVPLSEHPEEGKFNFETGSIKSFQHLEKPLFPTLPLVKSYYLQLVEAVLRAHGIGVFPIKQVIGVIVTLGLAWMGYTYITTHKKEVPIIVTYAPVAANPYESYNAALMTPSPANEVAAIIAKINELSSLPAWIATQVDYANGNMLITVKSLGGSTSSLYDWAQLHQLKVALTPNGYGLTGEIKTPARGTPKQVFLIDRVISSLIDKIAPILPGNTLNIAPFQSKGSYKLTIVQLNFPIISPTILLLLSEQFKDMPLVLTKLSITLNDGLTGTIYLQALGN